MYRVAFLRAGQPPKTWVAAFQQGLQERGYVNGQNVLVDFRFTDGSVDQLPRLAEELVRLKVDVIVASAAPPALAAKRVTTSVPIVFVGVAGPLELGLVRSLARPMGNITGLADSGPDLAAKRLETGPTVTALWRGVELPAGARSLAAASNVRVIRAEPRTMT